MVYQKGTQVYKTPKLGTSNDDRNTHRKLADLLVPAALPKATASIPLHCNV